MNPRAVGGRMCVCVCVFVRHEASEREQKKKTSRQHVSHQFVEKSLLVLLLGLQLPLLLLQQVQPPLLVVLLLHEQQLLQLLLLARLGGGSAGHRAGVAESALRSADESPPTSGDLVFYPLKQRETRGAFLTFF